MKRLHKVLLLTVATLGSGILLMATGAPDAGIMFAWFGLLGSVVWFVMWLLCGCPSLAEPLSATTASPPPPPSSPPPKPHNPTGEHKDYKSTPPPKPPPRTKTERHQAPPDSRASPDEVAHASVLGLRGRVTFAQIKRLYRERMMEYHPDRVASLGPKLREVAEHETKKINAAYEFFTAKYESDRNG